MTTRLEAPCGTCGSQFWCGRPCGSAPKTVAKVRPRPKTQRFRPERHVSVKPDAERYRDPAARKAYRREWMRRKREEEKP